MEQVLLPMALFLSHEKLIDDIAEIARLLPIWGAQLVEIISEGEFPILRRHSLCTAPKI